MSSKITEVQVRFADGTTKAIVGVGTCKEIKTGIKGDAKEKVKPRRVTYYEITIEVENEEV